MQFEIIYLVKRNSHYLVKGECFVMLHISVNHLINILQITISEKPQLTSLHYTNRVRFNKHTKLLRN